MVMGCSVDVIALLDKKCSGKKECEYYASERELILTKPCSPGATPYLHVKHQCIEGAYGLLYLYNLIYERREHDFKCAKITKFPIENCD